MNDFKLQPADILVNINDRKDLFSRIKRWALGSPYEHCFLYMGRLAIERSGFVSSYGTAVPMLFESSGRGAVLQTLSNRYGEKVAVMRLISEHDRRRIPQVLDEAIELASSPQAFYDYLCIVKYILPRLICEKLRLPVPVRWQRDPWHVCSEAIFEIFYRAKLVDILPLGVVPLPGDFVESPLLEKVYVGELSEGII